MPVNDNEAHLPDFLGPEPPRPLQWEVVCSPVFSNEINTIVNHISLSPNSSPPYTWFDSSGGLVLAAENILPPTSSHSQICSSLNSIPPLPDSKFVLFSS